MSNSLSSIPLSPPCHPPSGLSDSHAASVDLTGILELRVNSSSVGLYPVPPPTISNDTLAATAMTPGTEHLSSYPGSICLLSGPLGDFLRYSRQEASKWLIDIAHDICDPAHLRGSLLIWNESEWCPVTNTDPLTASVYRYDVPAGITIGLSKISLREGKSIGTDAVKRRDEECCWVTGIEYPLANTHICPKRMGDHVARIVFSTFVTSHHDGTPSLSVYDEICSLSLSMTLDTWFDTYELGFRFVSPNNYECHMFSIDIPDREYTVMGRIRKPTTLPAIHGHPARPPRSELSNIPPPGLFRWHYYNLPNINFPELPIRMEGDSDDDGTDSEADWPSKALDLGRDVENSKEEGEERHRAVAEWNSKTV
ncbi:hypothetical protein CPB85DRAFT_1338640 [Mucidula mucida]|nr:hypothetical protein CPB85DRAFT_1338640 [Mucidula mucida]